MTTTPTVTRKDLLTAMLSSGKMISRVEIKEVTMPPHQKAPLQLHPCPVVGVITQSIISYQVEGEKVQYLNVGDAFYEPAYARVSHFDNDGETVAKFVAFYLLEKDVEELIRILPE